MQERINAKSKSGMVQTKEMCSFSVFIVCNVHAGRATMTQMLNKWRFGMNIMCKCIVHFNAA